jgi:hypothetical protein
MSLLFSKTASKSGPAQSIHDLVFKLDTQTVFCEAALTVSGARIPIEPVSKMRIGVHARQKISRETHS